MPELRVVTTQQQKYALTGSIYQVLATLAVLAEGLLTQASIQTLVSFPDDFSLSGGKICLVIRLFHFGAGAPECWRIVLF